MDIELRIDADEFLSYLAIWSKGPTPDVAGMQLASGRPYDHWIARVLHSKNETPVGGTTVE